MLDELDVVVVLYEARLEKLLYHIDDVLVLDFQQVLDDDGAMSDDLQRDILDDIPVVQEVDDDEVEVAEIDVIGVVALVLRHIDEDEEIDLLLILLEYHLVMLVDEEDEVKLDEDDEFADEVLDEEMLVQLQSKLDEQQVHTEVDEDDELVVPVDELDANEYLYLDIQHLNDITLLDELNMSVIDTVFIALLLMEL